MDIANRIRTLRESRCWSQGDLEGRTGLARNYLSRVENGHTEPNLETLQKIAKGFGMKLYQLMYDGEAPPSLDGPDSPKDWASTGWGAKAYKQLRARIARMTPADRTTLLQLAEKMASRH